MSCLSDLKKFVSNVILAGAIAALVVFTASLFLPKYWLVSGKVVVFPSGSPASAAQNLAPEVGNTAWIVNSDTFQERNFGDLVGSFSGAEVVKNSSMVLVKFRSSETDIEAVEDLIVKIPFQAAEYARDLYDGSPFKYRMTGDPEVSAKPVQPNLIKNSIWGFIGGLILYFLYWLMLEGFLFRRLEREEKIIESRGETLFDFRPEAKKETIQEEIKFEGPEEKERKPAAAEEKTEPISAGPVPDNLPIAPASPAGGGEPTFPAPDFHEPSDEEVKERLNRLMRGEL